MQLTRACKPAAEVAGRSLDNYPAAIWVLAGASVTLDVPLEESRAPAFLPAPLPSAATTSPTPQHLLQTPHHSVPHNTWEADVNTLILQVTCPGLRGLSTSLGQAIGFLHSKEVQATPGWAHSTLKQNFLCHLPFSFTATCLIIFTWEGAGSLFSSLGFCERWPANSAFCGQKVDTADTPAQLRVSLPDGGGGSEDRGGSGELCCPPWLGNGNSPAERKNRKETRMYYYQAIIHTPLHFPNCKLFFM